MKLERNSGFSMIEILVVILVFATLAVLATDSLLLSLRGSRKSESTVSVRENLNYALSIIERQLHNAESVSCPSSTTISYDDGLPPADNFTCDLANGHIASSSAQLTTNEIRVTACNFICTPANAGVPASVSISLTGEDADSSSIEDQTVTANTQIMLRTY